MTVLEWLQSGTRYSFDKNTFIRIAYDRGCDPDADVYGGGVTQQQKELMDADVTYTAIMRGPSNTASISQSHNGYQKTVGSEQDYYQKDKLEAAIRIYKLYGDDKAGVLEDIANKKKISFLGIVDVLRV